MSVLARVYGFGTDNGSALLVLHPHIFAYQVNRQSHCQTTFHSTRVQILGFRGLTACHAVFGGDAIDGQTQLIQGGAGTVGLLAVQLAKWGGAHVIATTSNNRMRAAQTAGADVVLDYQAEDLSEQIIDANGGKLINRIIEVEFGLNVKVDSEVVEPNGTIAAYGSAQSMTPKLNFGPLAL